MEVRLHPNNCLEHRRVTAIAYGGKLHRRDAGTQGCAIWRRQPAGMQPTVVVTTFESQAGDISQLSPSYEIEGINQLWGRHHVHPAEAEFVYLAVILDGSLASGGWALIEL